MPVIYLLILVIFCTSAFGGAAWGEQAESKETVMPKGGMEFHLQDEDFEPVQIPDWVWESPVQTFDMRAPNFRDITKSAELGAQVVHNFGIKPYWPLKKDDPDSGVEPDVAADAKARIDKAHSLGMRYCFGVYPWAPIPLLRMHPEWAVHPEDNDKIEQDIKSELGDTIMMDEYEKLGRLCVMCFNTPYADFYIECLAEIVRDFNMDAISFDGNYHPRVCYCKFCKEKYKKDTGKDIPAKVDMYDVEYRKYLLWAGDQHEAFFARMHKRLRQVNPDFAVMSWSVNAGRWMQLTVPPFMSRRMNMLLDCPFQEWWLDEYHRGPTIVPAFGAAYGWAITGHRCAAAQPYFMSHWWPYGTDSFPEHEAIRRSLLVMTNGSYCPIPFNYDYADEVIKEVAKRAKWQVRARPHYWGAVLVSEQTRVNYGLDKMSERYLPYPLGIFRAAYEEHLPLTIVTEWDLRKDELAEYAVLFLPNAACLSDKQIEVIREYVANGGGLIASCDTSLFDEIGRPRPNFGLADVFGVRYIGRPGETDSDSEFDFSQKFDNKNFWETMGGIATLSWAESRFDEDAQIRKLSPNPNVSFKGGITRVSLPLNKADLLMTVKQSTWPIGTYDIGEVPIPGAVINNFGKGKVVYLAAGIDGAYYSYSYPYQRNLLMQSIRMVASRAPDIKVDAPMCVQATFFEQSDEQGHRLLVHLFNDIDTTSNHGDQEAEVPLREETIPIGGIKVHFKNYDVKAFRVEPEGTVLKSERSGEFQTVEIPALDMHSILVAELAPANPKTVYKK